MNTGRQFTKATPASIAHFLANADRYLATILGVPEAKIRERRSALGVVEAWDAVPVSGVENAAYYYSTYNGPDRVKTSDRRKILVLPTGHAPAIVHLHAGVRLETPRGIGQSAAGLVLGRRDHIHHGCDS